jgi:hypothetical protein
MNGWHSECGTDHKNGTVGWVDFKGFLGNMDGMNGQCK